jgi:hypothetical protein
MADVVALIVVRVAAVDADVAVVEGADVGSNDHSKLFVFLL